MIGLFKVFGRLWFMERLKTFSETFKGYSVVKKWYAQVVKFKAHGSILIA